MIQGNRSVGHVQRAAIVVVALVCAVLAGRAPAQDTPAATPPTPTEARATTPTPAAADRTVPRGAVQGFLDACAKGNFEQASSYLDLRRVRRADRKTQGPVLARDLSRVLDRKLWIDLDALSDEPEGDTEDNQPKNTDLVGTIATAGGAVPILLARVWEDGTAVWKFSSATVAQIPALYQEFGYGPLGDWLPPVFFELRFLQIQLWQWIGLVCLTLLAIGGSLLLTRLAVRIGRTLVQRSQTPIGSELLKALIGPLRLTGAALLFDAGVYGLALAIRAQAVVTGLSSVVAIIAAGWLAVRLVDILCEMLVARRHAAAPFMPVARRSARVFAAAVTLIAALQSLGFNATSLLAGLGIGGLAVALAGQKTVEQFFGSITLVADQPVRVGDFCRFGDRVGTVEDIGLRSTRIRTLDRTVVSIPNAEFAAMSIENFNKRDRIWLNTTLGLRYETTPDQLRWLLVELKRLLLAHPKVHPDPARVRFVGFGAYSLDLEIFAYILTADYNEFLAIREDLFLRIMDIVAAGGTGFAFPSQTNYVASDTGLDDGKRQAAEAHVQRWRADNAMYLPDFPAQQAAAISRTLDYPPRGSASRPR